MNTAYEMAKELVSEDSTLQDDELRARIKEVLDQLDSNRAEQTEFDFERQKTREWLTTRAYELSEREAALTRELQALLPQNPNPPQRVG